MLLTSRRSKRPFKPLYDTLRDRRVASAPTQWAMDRAFGVRISDYWNPRRDDFEPFDEDEKAMFIQSAWSALESIEPDISTEQLFARVMDMCDCAYDEITMALAGSN
jgi:hypothetical protein